MIDKIKDSLQQVDPSTQTEQLNDIFHVSL